MMQWKIEIFSIEETFYHWGFNQRRQMCNTTKIYRLLNLELQIKMITELSNADTQTMVVKDGYVLELLRIFGDQIDVQLHQQYELGTNDVEIFPWLKVSDGLQCGLYKSRSIGAGIN